MGKTVPSKMNKNSVLLSPRYLMTLHHLPFAPIWLLLVPGMEEDSHHIFFSGLQRGLRRNERQDQAQILGPDSWLWPTLPFSKFSLHGSVPGDQLQLNLGLGSLPCFTQDTLRHRTLFQRKSQSTSVR